MNQLESTDTVTLGEIVAILRRRRLQIVTIFALIFAGVAAGTLLMPKQYETRMKILVKNERADVVVSPGSNTATDFRGEVSESQINTEIELLTSNNLLLQVVTKCGLDSKEHPSSPLAADRPVIAKEMAVAHLQKGLKITPVRKSDIIEVKYSSKDPRLAAAVLRQMADSYLEAHLKVHGTHGSYEFFASQSQRYQAELKDAEAKLAALRQRDNIVMLQQQKDAILQQSSQSEAALLQADAATKEYADKIADTRKQLAASTPRVVTQSRTVSNQYSVERLTTMIAELQNRRTQLLSKFQPDDRLVLEADQEIKDTQAALAGASKLTGLDQATDVNPLHQTLEIDLAKAQAELAGVQAKRQSLAQQAQSYRLQLTNLGNATAEFDDLSRNQKEAEENYLLYAKKTEEARIAESLDQQKIANIAIAETPTESHIPSKPNVPLNLALGALLAGFLSLGVAFGAEHLQQPPSRIHTHPQLGPGIIQLPSELQELTGLPVLATLYRSP